MALIGAVIGVGMVLGVGGGILVAAFLSIVAGCQKLYQLGGARYRKFLLARAHRQLQEHIQRSRGYGYRNEQRP